MNLTVKKESYMLNKNSQFNCYEERNEHVYILFDSDTHAYIYENEGPFSAQSFSYTHINKLICFV